MIVGGILFYFLGVDPFAAIKMIFWDPLMSETFSTYSIPQIFIKGAPLILIALGLSVGFKANVWNIGAEGQYIMGAIFGASFALSLYPLESIFIFPAMILIGIIGGCLWSMIPAFLKVKFQCQRDTSFSYVSICSGANSCSCIIGVFKKSRWCWVSWFS